MGGSTRKPAATRHFITPLRCCPTRNPARAAQMPPRCPRRPEQPATSCRQPGARTDPLSSPPRRAQAPAEPPSGQRQPPATPTPLYDADREPGIPAARSPPWPRSGRPSASSSTRAPDHLPAPRTARPPVPCPHSTDQRSAPGRQRAEPSGPGCSSTCQGGAYRRRWPGVSAAAQPPKPRAAHAGPHRGRLAGSTQFMRHRDRIRVP